jgi:hypothetical protein
MLSSRLTFIIAFIVVCAGAPFVAAQEQQQRAEPQYVENTGFKNRIFEVRNRDPEELLQVIRLLTSGFKGAQVSADRSFKTITVRDFPENIAAIEDALRRLDTPEAVHPEVELHVHVLIAGNTELGASEVPAELKDVVGQLRSTLNFKNYYLLTSIIQRAKARPGYNPNTIMGNGIASITMPGDTAPRDLAYSFVAHGLSLGGETAGAQTVQLTAFHFHLEGGQGLHAEIHSDVGVREGEKVVVGTAGLKDKALILVLTAKLLK